MIHVKEHDYTTPDGLKFRCGISSPLPVGDTFFFDGEPGAWLKADCPVCNPGSPKKLGTPISQLSGRPGRDGFDAFKAIARSWGYE